MTRKKSLARWSTRAIGRSRPSSRPTLILYNTCSIRDKAEQKVFNRLNDYKKYQKQGKKFGVLGCVAQQEGEKIFERAPYVSLVCGSASYRNLPQMLVQLEAPDPDDDVIPKPAFHQRGEESRGSSPSPHHRTRRPRNRRVFRNRIHRPHQSPSRIHHHHRRLRQILRLLRRARSPAEKNAAALRTQCSPKPARWPISATRKFNCSART